MAAAAHGRYFARGAAPNGFEMHDAIETVVERHTCAISRSTADVISGNTVSPPNPTFLHARMATTALEHPLVGGDQVPRRLAEDGAPTILHGAPEVLVTPCPASRRIVR